MAQTLSPVARLVTNYFLTVETFHNSINGLSLINEVFSLSDSTLLISDADYNSYTQYTAWRWSTFVQHNALTA